MRSPRATSHAVQILHRRFVRDDKRKLAALAREHEKAEVAGKIYDLRTAARTEPGSAGAKGGNDGVGDLPAGGRGLRRALAADAAPHRRGAGPPRPDQLRPAAGLSFAGAHIFFSAQ